MDWFKLEEIEDGDIDNEIEEMNAQIEQEKAEKKTESVVGNEGASVTSVGNEGENAALQREENTTERADGNEGENAALRREENTTERVGGNNTSTDNKQTENKNGDEETIEDLEREMEEEEQRKIESGEKPLTYEERIAKMESDVAKMEAEALGIKIPEENENETEQEPEQEENENETEQEPEPEIISTNDNNVGPQEKLTSDNTGEIDTTKTESKTEDTESETTEDSEILDAVLTGKGSGDLTTAKDDLTLDFDGISDRLLELQSSLKKQIKARLTKRFAAIEKKRGRNPERKKTSLLAGRDVPKEIMSSFMGLLDGLNTPIFDLQVNAALGAEEGETTSLKNVGFADLKSAYSSISSSFFTLTFMSDLYFKDNEQITGQVTEVLGILQGVSDKISRTFEVLREEETAQASKGTDNGAEQKEADNIKAIVDETLPEEKQKTISEELDDMKDQLSGNTITVSADGLSVDMSPADYEAYLRIYGTPIAVIKGYMRYQELENKEGKLTAKERRERIRMRAVAKLAEENKRKSLYGFGNEEQTGEQEDEMILATVEEQGESISSQINAESFARIYQYVLYNRLFDGIKEVYLKDEAEGGMSEEVIDALMSGMANDYIGPLKDWVSEYMYERAVEREVYLGTLIDSVVRSTPKDKRESGEVVKKIYKSLIENYISVIFAGNSKDRRLIVARDYMAMAVLEMSHDPANIFTEFITKRILRSIDRITRRVS